MNKITALRKELGISQAELGRKIGVGQTTISAWEKGTRQPDHECLRLLAHYFGVTVDNLLSDEKALPEKWANLKESGEYMPLSSQEKQILDMFRESSEMGKMRMIQAVLHVWDEEHIADR